MKKTALFLLSVFVCFFVLFYISCKKKSSTTPATAPATYNAAAVAASQPGILVASQNQITVKSGSSFTVSVTLFSSDGTPFPATPTFAWTADNATVASTSTVSTGSTSTCTGMANDTGMVTLTVTDGSHGYTYIYVHVVSAATNLPAGAANIAFASPMLVVKTGASASFSYGLTDVTGNTISGTPSFFSSASGITISGSSVTAGATPGLYEVTAVLGSDTLAGTMNVLVYDGKAAANDTTWTISALIRYPIRFPGNKVSAPPVVIQVTGYSVDNTGTVNVKTFQTSPDQIEVDYPNVVTVSNGVLTSVNAGSTFTKLIYKGASKNTGSFVIFDPSGSWGSGTINFCFSGSEPIYFNGFYVGEPTYYMLYNTGCDSGGKNWYGPMQLYSASGNILPAPLGPLPDGSGLGSGFVMDCAGSAGLIYNDSNHITYVASGKSIKLTRGSGNCSGGTGPALTLDQLLSSGKTWTGNTCFYNAMVSNVFTFHSDHTVLINGSAGSGTDIWYTSENKNIFLIEGDTVDFVVKSFTANSIVFDTTSMITGVDWDNCVPAWSAP